MPILFRDFEARSSIDIAVGTRRFVNDETTEFLCCAFAVDDGPVQEIKREQLKLPPPPEFIAAHQNPDWLVVAHHDAFETAVEERLRWPVVPLERHRCTAAMARACALPGSLDGAAEALGLEIRKDKAGARLMKQIATRKIEPTADQLEILSSGAANGAVASQSVGHGRSAFRPCHLSAAEIQTSKGWVPAWPRLGYLVSLRSFAEMGG